MRISDWSSDVCSSDLRFSSHPPDAQPRSQPSRHRNSSAPTAHRIRSRCAERAPRYKVDRNDLHDPRPRPPALRSEEHTSELQSLMRISYAVFCLKKKKTNIYTTPTPSRITLRITMTHTTLTTTTNHRQ